MNELFSGATPISGPVGQSGVGQSRKDIYSEHNAAFNPEEGGSAGGLAGRSKSVGDGLGGSRGSAMGFAGVAEMAMVRNNVGIAPRSTLVDLDDVSEDEVKLALKNESERLDRLCFTDELSAASTLPFTQLYR